MATTPEVLFCSATFWFGDTNFRIDDFSRESVIQSVRDKAYTTLLQKDQVGCRAWDCAKTRLDFTNVSDLLHLMLTELFLLYCRGLQAFFSERSRKQLHSISRAGHLTWCDCFGISYILANQEIFRKFILFSLFTKWLRGPDLASGP